MARNIVRRLFIVGPIIVGIAWLVRGQLGALSAAIGVAVIAANFLLSGWLLSRAATVSMQVYHAAALFGFFIRLGFITASMFLAAFIFDVDRKALGAAAIVAFLALLAGARAATAGGRFDAAGAEAEAARAGRGACATGVPVSRAVKPSSTFRASSATAPSRAAGESISTTWTLIFINKIA